MEPNSHRYQFISNAKDFHQMILGQLETKLLLKEYRNFNLNFPNFANFLSFLIL